MAEPRYGEVWMCDFSPTRGREQAGRRPCLVVSDDRFNRSGAELALVVPITSKSKGIPYHVEISPPEGGLTQRSFAKCEDLRSISHERFERYMGAVEDETLDSAKGRMRLLLRL